VSLLIVSLVISTLLPILVVVALLFTELQQDLKRAGLQQARSFAHNGANVFDGQLHDMAVTLKLIASSPELATGDLQAFYQRTKLALVGSSWFLLLVDDSGQQLLNLRVPFGTPLGKTANMAPFEMAISTQRLLVSSAFFGHVGRQWVFNVVLPLPANQVKRGVALILTQNLAEIDAKLDAQTLPRGWASVLIDGSNRVLASSTSLPLGSVFQPPTGLAKASNGSTIQGDVLFAETPVPEADGWRVLVWGPSAAASSPVLWSWWQLLVGGGFLLAVSFTFAVQTGRTIQRAISTTSDMAVRLGQGEVVAVPSLPFKEAQMIASAISEASTSRHQAEAQLSVALHELAHRLKNLVTVVQSLVRQTGRHTSDVTEFRRLLSDRLFGLSNSISLLIAHHRGDVPIEELVRAQLGSFLVEWDRIKLTGTPIMIGNEAVQGMGMILHELATNAIKYGALSRPQGTIQISWSEEPATGFTRVIWRETDVTSCAEIVRGFGSELIEGTAAMLGGSAILSSADGQLVWTLKLNLRARAAQT